MFWLAHEQDSASRPHHSLVVERNGQPTKTRKYHVVARMGPNHSLGVYNNGVHSVERALVERYFLCKVGDEFLPAIVTASRDWDSRELVRFRQCVVEQVRETATVLTLRQVVNCYRGPKYRIYESAHRSLMRKGLNKKDSYLRPFTKFEKQALDKAPRIINPRSPRYNLVLGKYLKKAEKLYFGAINKVWGEHTTHTVIKGMNVFETASVMRAKWDRFQQPVAIGLDASKFDMHVSVQALRYEHSFYNRVFRSFELEWLLAMQVYNRGKAYCPDGEVSFKMAGTRSSGDLNTSLGNCVLMCSLIWAMCQQLGVKAELANNGDDCVLFVEEHDVERVLEFVPTFFRTYGFRMTVEDPVREFESVEFCQSKPVWIGGGWAMVRNMVTCLKKDPICLIPIQNDKIWRKWLGAVGECGQASVPGCPVLQSFYGAFRRAGTRAGAKFTNRLFNNTGAVERRRGLEVSRQEVSPEARASFYRAFGLTPDYQIALEEYYDRFEIGALDESIEYKSGQVECQPPAFLRHL